MRRYAEAQQKFIVANFRYGGGQTLPQRRQIQLPAMLVNLHRIPPAHGQVRLGFADGTQKEVDLEPYLRGPLFAAMRADPAAFRAVRVVGSSIGWENGADIDPDVLYYGLTPSWAETGNTTSLGD